LEYAGWVLGIPYYQQFVGFPIHQITNNWEDGGSHRFISLFQHSMEHEEKKSV
jgi:hypothetical protein